jgi:hypothetical protein
MVTPMHPEEGCYPRRYRDLVSAKKLLEQRDTCLPLKILVIQAFQILEHLPPMPVERIRELIEPHHLPLEGDMCLAKFDLSQRESCRGEGRQNWYWPPAGLAEEATEYLPGRPFRVRIRPFHVALHMLEMGAQPAPDRVRRMIWLTTVLTSTESYGYVNLTESMRRKRSVRGALVTEGGYEKADTRVGHWNGQRGRGMIVRGPEPGTSHPPGSDSLLRGNREEYGRALWALSTLFSAGSAGGAFPAKNVGTCWRRMAHPRSGTSRHRSRR